MGEDGTIGGGDAASEEVGEGGAQGGGGAHVADVRPSFAQGVAGPGRGSGNGRAIHVVPDSRFWDSRIGARLVTGKEEPEVAVEAAGPAKWKKI